MKENQFQEIPNTFNPKARKRLPKKTVVLIVFIVLVILSVFFVKVTSKPNVQSTETISTSPSPIETSMPSLSPEASSSPSESPSPTPKPSVNPIDKATGLDRSKLNVAVKNGSGEAGVGGKAADYLKNLGYNISSTGNADNYNYTNVFIQISQDKSQYLSLLKKDLGFNYTIGTTSADLSTSLSEDALVIIGK